MYRLVVVALAGALSGCAALAGLKLPFLGSDDARAAAGLREALQLATTRASARLGRPDGYWSEDRYRIPLPGMVERAARYLRAGGHREVMDEFHRGVNRAAEEATPEIAPLLALAIQQLELRDAGRMRTGSGAAATAHLERHSRERLARQILPLVSAAMARMDVPRLYAQLIGRAGPLASFLRKEQDDLNLYVAERTLDGLFRALAEEEQRLRRDSAARLDFGLQKILAA